MIRHGGVELVPAGKEHLAPFLVWLNSLPKNRLRPFAGKKLLNTDQVQNLLGGEITKHRVYFSIGKKNCVGFAALGPLDWRNRKITAYTYVDPSTDEAALVEGNAMRALVRYAFGDLNVNKIQVEILLGDAFLTQLYKQIGFTPEVRKRSHHFSEGTYHHVLEMALLASEYDFERDGDLSSTAGEE